MAIPLPSIAVGELSRCKCPLLAGNTRSALELPTDKTRLEADLI